MKISRTICFVMAIMMMVMVLPVTAFAEEGFQEVIPLANNGVAKSASVSNIDSAWLTSTEMVDWNFAELKTYLNNEFKKDGATTDSEKLSVICRLASNAAVYNTALVESNPVYIPQKSTSECFYEVRANQQGSTGKPKWLCGDFTRYAIGLLRAAGYPSYMEVGKASSGEYHAWVAFVVGNTCYWWDPTFGTSSGNPGRYFQMTAADYNNNYTPMYISSEKTPKDKLERQQQGQQNQGSSTVKNQYTATAINVPAGQRFGDTELKLKINGEQQSVIYISSIEYDDKYLVSARDVCMIFGLTSRKLNVEWLPDRNTIGFNMGAYQQNGSEKNWTSDVEPTLSKTAQAYLLTGVVFENEETDITVVLIDGVSFVDFNEIANTMNLVGQKTVQEELGFTFKVTRK